MHVCFRARTKGQQRRSNGRNKQRSARPHPFRDAEYNDNANVIKAMWETMAQVFFSPFSPFPYTFRSSVRGR